MKRGIGILLFSILWILCLGLLVSGSTLLMQEVFEGFPGGTIIALLAIIGFSGMFFLLTRPLLFPYLRLFFGVHFVLSFLWVFMAYAMAGNWAMNFSSTAVGFQGSPRASSLFWSGTFFFVIAPLSLYPIYLFN